MITVKCGKRLIKMSDELFGVLMLVLSQKYKVNVSSAFEQYVKGSDVVNVNTELFGYIFGLYSLSVMCGDLEKCLVRWCE